MITEKSFLESLEIAFRSTGLDIPPMSELVGGDSRLYEFANEALTFSFFSVDLLFGASGAVALEESNGSNGASTGVSSVGQTLRARHMAAAALARKPPAGCVMLLAHADSTGLTPEFHLRRALFSAELQRNGIDAVRAGSATERLGEENVAVILGRISDILPSLDVVDGGLRYQGRPVAFATNANILPALVREGRLAMRDGNFDLDTTVFHEGANGVRVTMDKALQQRLAEGTGLQPLRTEVCGDWLGASAAIDRWNRDGVTAVAKINQGSQGVGIQFFPSSGIERIEEKLRSMRLATQKAYGENADASALPIRLFEFFESSHYRIAAGEHLWDVRVEVHVSPGKTAIIPTSARICPVPFDCAIFDRDSVISNLSGRGNGMRFVRNPFGMHESGVIEIEWAGVDEFRFATAMGHVASWAERGTMLDGYE